MHVTNAMAEALRAYREFGLTNDERHLQAVRDFTVLAVSDGWSIAPMHESEPMDRRAELKRDGYVIHAVARDNGESAARYRYEAKLAGWGPDGLAIKLPPRYDWLAIQAATLRCNICGATDVPTVRYSFAGRCCLPCLPYARRTYETGAWRD